MCKSTKYKVYFKKIWIILRKKAPKEDKTKPSTTEKSEFVILNLKRDWDSGSPDSGSNSTRSKCYIYLVFFGPPSSYLWSQGESKPKVPQAGVLGDTNQSKYNNNTNKHELLMLNLQNKRCSQKNPHAQITLQRQCKVLTVAEWSVNSNISTQEASGEATTISAFPWIKSRRTSTVQGSTL